MRDRKKKHITCNVSHHKWAAPLIANFCLTGVMGFKRQLTAASIAQVTYAFSIGSPISNIVFMGMGEPLLNYKPVFKAIHQLCSEETYNISKRRITVSTSGYIQGVRQLIDDKNYINLAFFSWLCRSS